MNSDLTVEHFQTICATRNGTHPTTYDWNIQDWALAIAGEAGELANLAKKIRRGDFSQDAVRGELLRELADVITYCTLAIDHLNGDMASVLMEKFAEVNLRRKRLEEEIGTRD